MSWQRVTLFCSAALLAGGFVMRATGIALGLELMIIAVFIAIVSQSFTQRASLHALSTTRRGLMLRLRELGEAEEKTRAAVDELTALQRTTLYYAKNPPNRKASSTEAPDANASRTGAASRAGRSSTPNVTNASADAAVASLLDPTRAVAVHGVLSRSTAAALPSGAVVKPFVPGRAAESLATDAVVDLIVVDEAALSDGQWSRSTGAAGIAIMRDLLEAIRVAQSRGIAAVVIPASDVPDIHSDALKSSAAIRLPLTEALIEPAAGAPLSAVLVALDGVALRRVAA